MTEVASKNKLLRDEIQKTNIETEAENTKLAIKETKRFDSTYNFNSIDNRKKATSLTVK